ncbi:MAG: hypothetical protein NC548_13010 [Lachnospiraceae bacterium]|nr:hypothetical protein [Lachnospiraceae bacterium]MCM1230690.1 hypothetical protein [Ruminococcus flavefaciens]
MAKKKLPSIEDALELFKQVMTRSSLSNYVYVNNTMLTKSPKGYSVVIIPEQELWNKIIEDESLKSDMRELDEDNQNDAAQKELIVYGDQINDNGWIEADPNVLFAGKVFKIKIHGFEYEIPINRDLLPLKLRKAEYNNIAYRVFTAPSVVLALKKKFDYKDVDGGGFTIMRLFKVL